MCGAIPGLVVLGSMRNQAEQASSQHPHSRSIGSCLQVPALSALEDELLFGTVSEINPFLPRLLLVMAFHHSTSFLN